MLVKCIRKWIVLIASLIIFLLNRSNEECFERYNNDENRWTLKHYLPDGLTSAQYCAESATGSGRTRPGDSGGPSIIRTNNDGPQFQLLGVVSGGFQFTRLPGYYTFIAHEQVNVKSINVCNFK